MSSRRRRRRHERERAKQRRPDCRMSAPARLGAVAGGIVLILGGIGLLIGGGGSNAERIGRLAGILILIGIALFGVGAWGRL